MQCGPGCCRSGWCPSQSGCTAPTQAHELEFHQFEQGTSDRIRNKRVNERNRASSSVSRLYRSASGRRERTR